MLKSVAIIGAILFFSLCVSGQEQDKAPPPKELVQYVRDAQKAGQNPAQIQQNAVNAGWAAATVSDTLAYVNSLDKDKTRPEPDAKPAEPVGTVPGASPRPAEAPAGTEVPPAGAGKSPDPAAEGGGPHLPHPNANALDDYKIGAGDVLKITVWHEADASLPSAVVLPSGRISVPLLHEVEVSGLTVPQLEKLLTERFSSVINAPEVSVVVTGMNSKKIYITGKVKKEGPLSLTYPMTVMQALSEAGGVTDYAKKKGIYVLRTENGKQFNLKFDYAAVLKGEHLETNIQLIPGDMIVVP